MALVTCPICGNVVDRPIPSECPSCGVTTTMTGFAAGDPLKGVRMLDGIIRDPVAMLIWELLRFVPNGTIEDAIARANAQMKLNNGAFKAAEIFLAEHCNALARVIRGESPK